MDKGKITQNNKNIQGRETMNIQSETNLPEPTSYADAVRKWNQAAYMHGKISDQATFYRIKARHWSCSTEEKERIYKRSGIFID